MATEAASPHMTLGNMRSLGVPRLDVKCGVCHHSAVIDVDCFDDEMAVPQLGPRMICTRCGIISADARPNCNERPERPSITGEQWR